MLPSMPKDPSIASRPIVARWCGPCHAGWLRNGSGHGATVPGPAILDVRAHGIAARPWPMGLQPIMPCLPASPGSTTGSTRRSSTDRRIMRPDSPPRPAAASIPAVVQGVLRGHESQHQKLETATRPRQPQSRPAAADPDLLRRQEREARPRKAQAGARDRALNPTRGVQNIALVIPTSANSTTSPPDRRRRAD